MTADEGAAPGESARPVTIVVDGANVVGSRPDGWWRDRAGAAVRLHDSLVPLAARGAAGLPAGLLVTGDDPGAARAEAGAGAGSGPGAEGAAERIEVLLVLEGAAKAALSRIAGAAGQAPGPVRVVAAPRSGDDEIVRLAQSLPGRRIVVTADRELRRRSVAAGAEVAGPSWLYGLL